MSYIGAQQAAVIAIHAVEETQTLTCIARVDVATFQYQSTNVRHSLPTLSRQLTMNVHDVHTLKFILSYFTALCEWNK